MLNTVIIFEPGKLPRFIANVKRVSDYKGNKYAVINPTELPAEELKYWQKVTRSRLGYYKSQAIRQQIDQKVAEVIERKHSSKRGRL